MWLSLIRHGNKQIISHGYFLLTSHNKNLWFGSSIRKLNLENGSHGLSSISRLLKT
jgi:hypothetical protein